MTFGFEGILVGAGVVIVIQALSLVAIALYERFIDD